MATAKVIELIGEGKTLEAAIEAAVAEASKSVRGIEGVWVEDFKAMVDGGKVTAFRANVKITFLVE